MKLLSLFKKSNTQPSADSQDIQESHIVPPERKLAGLNLHPDAKHPNRKKYLYTIPQAKIYEEQYEPEFVEIKDIGLSSNQTMRLLNINKNRLKYLLRHGPLWRVPSLSEDGKPRRFRRISIKSILDYLRMRDEKRFEKLAAYWQI